MKYGTLLSIGYKGFAAKRGADYTSKLNLKNRIMNTEKTSLENERQPSCLGDVISHFNSDTFIDNVCLSYRHDFGLIAEQDRQRLRFECKEWMRAISNNLRLFQNGNYYEVRSHLDFSSG